MGSQSGPCTRVEADEADADRFPSGPPAPVTSRALANELKHLRRMAGIETDTATSALWTSLADQIDAYLNPTGHHEPALFAHTVEATP